MSLMLNTPTCEYEIVEDFLPWKLVKRYSLHCKQHGRVSTMTIDPGSSNWAWAAISGFEDDWLKHTQRIADQEAVADFPTHLL